MKHDLLGNCVDDAAYSRFDDICPDHDEPRGDCSVCGPCDACEAFDVDYEALYEYEDTEG